MTVSDVFTIKGRGTVVTGRLEGTGQLNVGDTLVWEGQHWPVSGLEQFRATPRTVLPGTSIGILLRDVHSPDLLRGKTVQFVTSTQAGVSTPGGVSPQPAAAAKKRGLWRR
jgi:elongation factor Tu